jgi:hypothetical protein
MSSRTILIRTTESFYIGFDEYFEGEIGNQGLQELSRVEEKALLR